MSWRYFARPRVTEHAALSTVVRPVVTERSTGAVSQNRYTFEVADRATKQEIASAVEGLFKVTVVSVNTLNKTGKLKRFRGHSGQQRGCKHAVVRIRDGQSIDYTRGV